MVKNTYKYLLLIGLVAFAFGQCAPAPEGNEGAANNTVADSSESVATNHIVIDSVALINDVKTLSSNEFEGRATGTSGNLKAQEYIVSRMQTIGLKTFNDSYQQEFTFKDGGKSQQGVNLLGYIPGKKFPDKYIVLTGHYDHLGIENGAMYNGADDNASGVAGILAAAKYFNQHPADHSILIAALDAEEINLDGAKALVKEGPVAIKNMVLNVNLDMISRNDQHEIYVCGTHHYPELKAPLESLATQSAIKVSFGHDEPSMGYDDWTMMSDHAPFHKKSIPFIYLGVEDHADYHQPTDVFENIDPWFFIRTANLVVQITKEMDVFMQKK